MADYWHDATQYHVTDPFGTSGSMYANYYDGGAPHENRPPYTALTYITPGPNGVSALLSSGAVIMWSGSLTSLPMGWLLCNGSSDTRICETDL